MRAAKGEHGTTPEHLLTPQAQGVPDNPVPLPRDALACLVCGVPVLVPDPAEVIELASRGHLRPVPASAEYGDLRFARCGDCRAALALAATLVATRPVLGRAIGSPAVHQAEGALTGLRVVRMGDISRSTLDALRADLERLDEVDLLALVRRMAVPGLAARWAARFSPVIDADARLGTCSRYPFAHVRLGPRADLRSAYAGVLNARMARIRPPVRVPPPALGPTRAGVSRAPGGCLFCGVSRQVVAAEELAGRFGASLTRAAAAVWHPRTVGLSQLGLRAPLRQQVAGHLCATCNEAVQVVGSVGSSARERALVAALVPSGLGRLGYGQMDLRGVARGWGALVHLDPTTRANGDVAWAHLGNIDGLREALAGVLGGVEPPDPAPANGRPRQVELRSLGY